MNKKKKLKKFLLPKYTASESIPRFDRIQKRKLKLENDFCDFL